MTPNELEMVERILRQVQNADLTPEYVYGWSADGRGNYLNNAGIAPASGCRWSTPRQICAKYQEDIESGKFEEVLSEISGKTDIPDEPDMFVKQIQWYIDNLNVMLSIHPKNAFQEGQRAAYRYALAIYEARQPVTR